MNTLDLAANLVYTRAISSDEIEHDGVYLALVSNTSCNSVEVVQASVQGRELNYYKFGYEPELYETDVTPVFKLVSAELLKDGGEAERYLENLILGNN
ncbi:hypothetical protein NVP1215B_021 [Vibrio phage 1.215.B._10N.222.54.F7]|nr:hypothetical protein NVP1215A_021 [Vibrio phage 1.215.A._10N.222.54.F7]AUR96044.1 hypothetical protein NVP1215B_021 [Vibrio phage 1.215.B._10N.222.54.F7]